MNLQSNPSNLVSISEIQSEHSNGNITPKPDHQLVNSKLHVTGPK